MTIPVTIPAVIAGRDLQVRLHAADVAAGSPARLLVVCGDWVGGVDLPTGLGVQLKDPEHLAYPETALVVIPSTAVTGPEVALSICLEAGEWISWDAVHIVAVSKE